MSETTTIKCQWCIERQVKEPEDAIGLYNNQPICDGCLTPIMANKENVQADTIAIPATESNSLKERLQRACELLDNFELVFDSFPLTAEEVLENRDQFYNHRAPALINCSVQEIKTIINRRKAVLYSIRIKDERWSVLIEKIREEERHARGLEGTAKSVKEKAKKPSGYSNDKAKQLAKMMGITVEQLNAMGAEARVEEFGEIVGKENAKAAMQHKSDEAQGAKKMLKTLQDKIAGNESSTLKRRKNPFTGKYEDE